jgi:alkylhydroperoxidase family enzyme
VRAGPAARYNWRMPRLPEIAEPGDDPILKEIWAREHERYGTVLNTTKILAHRPGILRAAKQLAQAVEESGLLPPDLLALVYLRVARLNRCPF